MTEKQSRRIRNAAASARHDQAMTKAALLTLLADSSAPNDPRAKAAHYKHHLAEAHRTIEILQIRNSELERDRDKIKKDAEYWLSLSTSAFLSLPQDSRGLAQGSGRSARSRWSPALPICPTRSDPTP